MPWSPSGWKDWWLARLPRSDEHTLTQRNVYILPTRAGWMLAVTLLVLLLASINYQLNLGYLLTFLLAGSSVAGMHMAHANLRGLRLQLRAGATAFAGHATDVVLTLNNPARRARYGIALRWGDAAPDSTTWADVPARASGQTTLRWTPPRRGRMGLPPILLETRFPMGSFRVWTWWRTAATWLVYPAPEPAAPPWPEDAAQEHGVAAAPAPQPDGERDALRPYRRGDPLKWVVWKKAAKQADRGPSHWISRDAEPAPRGPLWLRHDRCALNEIEPQRSRLCAWVLRAEQQGLDYGLVLPGLRIAPGRGPAHQARCLEALACH